MIKFKLSNSFIYAAAFLLLVQGCGGRSEDCKPKGRYLVVRPYAGMANRLRVLASAKIMAALTDRHLIVDWEINKHMPGQWSDFFLNPMTMFDASPLALKDGCSLDDITTAHVGDSYVKNLGIQNDLKDLKQLAELPAMSEPVIFFGTSMNFSPYIKYLSSDEYRERYRLFYQNLDPALRISKAVKLFQKENHFDKKYMIGVHYRSWNTGKADIGDVQQDLQHKYLSLFIDKMKEAVAESPAQTANKPVAFFLATDDANVKEKMLAVPELAGRIVTAPYVIERDTITGTQNALIDWFLLGSTRYILGTYQSSFSDEAAYLTTQGRKVPLGAQAYP